MARAQRARTQENRAAVRNGADDSDVLKEKTVLERLETGFYEDDAHDDPNRAITGIRNGVLVGSIVWLLLLAALALALAL